MGASTPLRIRTRRQSLDRLDLIDLGFPALPDSADAAEFEAVLKAVDFTCPRSRDLPRAGSRRRFVLVVAGSNEFGDRTALAINLALTAARGGARVVLLDAAGRNAKLTRRCGLAAFGLNFVASPNLTGNATLVFVARRFLEFCRTVPDIVFALIFVVAFGLGPLPGVLALAIHSAGALGKQFFETTENIDMKPVEGLRAVGASWVQTIRFAALPQVIASFSTFALLRFEINVRGATVLGFVGAGGIGQDLMEAIRKFYYSDVSAILVMIIAVVMAIDISTQYLRRALLSKGRLA